LKLELNRIAEGLERNEIPLGVFANPELYEFEKRRIFARNWCYLSHESEIPKTGDFIQRYILDDSFIVSRDEAGDVNVLLNACRYRGLGLCKAEKGNTRNFKCPYHGWVYGLDGSLRDVPYKDELFATDSLRETEWGLVPAPRVEIWNSMIFANLDHNAPRLETYLGDARFYIEFYTNKTEEGLEVYGVPQRWVVDADWKLAADNFVGDGYHTFITHSSTITAGSLPAPGGEFLKDGVQVVLENFGVGFARQDSLFNSLAYPPSIMQQVRQNLSTSQLQILDQGVSLPTHSTLFPNLSFLNAPGGYAASAPPAPYMTFRVWRPLAAGKTEIWSWCLVEKNSTEEFKQACYRAYVISFGASGTLEQDDAENWMTITKAARGNFSATLPLNYSMGLRKQKPMKNWPGPGDAYPMDFSEFAQRAFWRKWLAELQR